LRAKALLLRELRRRLKTAFDAAGIEIPFPQRTLWMRSAPGEPATALPEDPHPADTAD
jgi:small conductance mechanosensitive channel